MSVALTRKTDRRRAARPERRRARRGADPASGCRELSGPTLEESIFAALAELSESGRTTCLVCGSESLKPSGCGACGSVLA
jgi:hypothetical protein